MGMRAKLGSDGHTNTHTHSLLFALLNFLHLSTPSALLHSFPLFLSKSRSFVPSLFRLPCALLRCRSKIAPQGRNGVFQARVPAALRGLLMTASEPGATSLSFSTGHIYTSSFKKGKKKKKPTMANRLSGGNQEHPTPSSPAQARSLPGMGKARRGEARRRGVGSLWF